MGAGRPLEGIRVADFTWVWAGPFCTLQLAHLGAEVIRIETASRPCVTRMLPPWLDGKPGINRSGYFNQYNQGKLSLSLDLKQPRAVEIAKELVAQSDIVCENFAAGVMVRFGLGYEVLSQVKPDIIMIAMSGYGASGPEHEYVSYGPAQVPLSGMSSLTGYSGWPPMHVGISYGDPTGGLHGAFAVLAALLYRQRTGKGQFIDLSQQETSIAVLPEGVLAQTMNGEQPPRSGNRDPWMAPHGVFRCAGEQRWVSLAVRNDKEWHRLASAIGNAALADDKRFSSLQARKANEDELEKIITAWTLQHSPEDITEVLQGIEIASFPAFNSQDLSDDPHLNRAGAFVELEHPEVGRLRHIGMPWRMLGTPCAVERPAPCLGQHTDYVMSEILGHSDGEIAELKSAGVLR
ncbi:MAG: CoA transferase [Deltaproteobacteria bacterium]|nr:CoA transferase [Deltaproteobacteria bacterium]